MGIFSFFTAKSSNQRLKSIAFNPQYNWWSQATRCRYEPPIYSFLDDNEWEIFDQWHKEIYLENWRGESAIPFMSLLQAFIMGNDIDSIVEFGCFAGFSTLLIGFMMKKMGHSHSFASIDITPAHCQFTKKWVNQANLSEFVKIYEGSSHDPHMVSKVLANLKQNPKLIIIDSSHQYQQTLNELNSWFEYLQPGGFFILHDSSIFASKFDNTGQGGVHKAFSEWVKNKENISSININSGKLDNYIYLDDTGIGIIQKIEKKST